jgi:hypothetical protein
MAARGDSGLSEVSALQHGREVFGTLVVRHLVPTYFALAFALSRLPCIATGQEHGSAS